MAGELGWRQVWELNHVVKELHGPHDVLILWREGGKQVGWAWNSNLSSSALMAVLTQQKPSWVAGCPAVTPSLLGEQWEGQSPQGTRRWPSLRAELLVALPSGRTPGTPQLSPHHPYCGPFSAEKRSMKRMAGTAQPLPSTQQHQDGLFCPCFQHSPASSSLQSVFSCTVLGFGQPLAPCWTCASTGCVPLTWKKFSTCSRGASSRMAG